MRATTRSYCGMRSSSFDTTTTDNNNNNGGRFLQQRRIWWCVIQQCSVLMMMMMLILLVDQPGPGQGFFMDENRFPRRHTQQSADFVPNRQEMGTTIERRRCSARGETTCATFHDNRIFIVVIIGISQKRCFSIIQTTSISATIQRSTMEVGLTSGRIVVGAVAMALDRLPHSILGFASTWRRPSGCVLSTTTQQQPKKCACHTRSLRFSKVGGERNTGTAKSRSIWHHYRSRSSVDLGGIDRFTTL